MYGNIQMYLSEMFLVVQDIQYHFVKIVWNFYGWLQIQNKLLCETMEFCDQVLSLL
jgi:hypothetical protein